MSNQRTHYVSTTDGVTIGGTVHGQGPPLVFVHGMVADGDTDWQALLPHLTGRFTCYLPSYRGRGLSGDHPDLSPGRMVDDILAYVDSIEASTGLVGWSSGAYLAVTVAAAQSDAVGAVAPFEPGVLSLMDEQQQAAFGDARRPHGRAGRRRQVDGCGSRVRWLALQRRRDRHGRGRGLLRGRRTLRPEPAQPPPAMGGIRRPNP
jgi:pimeloyl-ACP methyl ester carboxylesterase